MSQLSEVRTKIDRAETNIENLKKLLPVLGPSEIPGKFATFELQPDGQTHDVFLEPVVPSPLLRLAIGDVVHELRTALDHLAYQLAIINNFPVHAASRTKEQSVWLRSLCFLIKDDPQRFSSAAGSVKKVIGSLPVAEMEKLQPYKGLDSRGPILWKLSELDNITKHRVIVAVEPKIDHADVRIGIDDSEAFSGPMTVPPGATMKDRTKLFSLVVAVPAGQPPPKVDVNIQSKSRIEFADTDGLCDGERVFPFLRDAVRAVRDVVNDFDRLFF